MKNPYDEYEQEHNVFGSEPENTPQTDAPAQTPDPAPLTQLFGDTFSEAAQTPPAAAPETPTQAEFAPEETPAQAEAEPISQTADEPAPAYGQTYAAPPIPPQPQTGSTETPRVDVPRMDVPQYGGQENPIYSQQPYAPPPYRAAQAPGAQAPYGYRPPTAPYPAAPSQPEKPKRKGGKVFAACIALLLVFALGVGVASIFRSGRSAERNGGTNQANDNAPQLALHESPTSVTKLESKADTPLTPAQIAAKVAGINVGVLVSSRSASGEGSGIVMGEDSTHTYTYIITCAHVIDNAGLTVRVQTADGTTYDAEIVGFDRQTDIGVLRIKAKGLTAAEFGDSDALVVGDPVYAIGNPGGTELFGSFTTGYVSAIGRSVQSEIGYTMECIQHNAAISPGNSGGALVNQYGQVVGINSQKITATEYEGLSFAVPITQAKEIIDDLIKYSYVPNRAMLGITYYPVTASQQYYMVAQIKGLPAGTLIIDEIKSGSSLEGTNARKYDMIIAVDGKDMDTADVLLERIDNGKVGDKLTLTLCRVNSDYSLEQFDVEVTLVEDRTGSEEVTTTTQQYVNPFDFFNQYGF
ncbi:MAG: trypsin-like peptidase domain-containing protein [Clostridia bacterium]|nr:trypsin-like peptidase domain-containing protein [Clostridia bacterium]